ncbi:nucleotide-binding domain-containing protein [Metschnikowia bicuspidata var. bicuspidata NRRL YB-4993]|uniref:NADPH:adrenodoxin oxidoreductase, mitochondrial n=1 Tax=Metschnikowia bicuspidata var. bicuspidata NRRL YB-4993 TaxID=869754 RepID=A0A1A0H7P7_9ASCO|nr:nucleotide-binding domain-containing protein [Metschnikowia bicuspidata var. bicuspidata NRRL YB-4993]OBA19923.1 nucleotide-binding domain-containing protein [Metschnikowia bicuspidata var. bicuspidata NRRL YB-4993]
MTSMICWPIARRGITTSRVANYNVAIVGAGPAGFYTAHHLLHKSKHMPITVDFFDRLPTPYGLSRYGVAPDHPEVKNCEEYMNKLWTDFSDKVRFFGNVNIGKDILLAQLEARYNSIVLSYGCTAFDIKLDIPGSSSPGVISAREFVNWYNGHPDSKQGSHFIPPLEKVRNVTIIGNGNVAIDIARVLLADPKSHWAPTDITSEAVELLSRSKVERVNIVARRGILESAFTNKEIRELLEISKELNIKFLPIPENVLAPIRQKAKLLARVEKRKFSILDKASSQATTPGESSKEWCLEFQLSPKQFVPSDEDAQLLKSTVFEVNELQEDSLTKKVTNKGTGKEIRIENDLVILSIGYKGEELEGFTASELEFTQKDNRIANNEGRILRSGAAAAGKEEEFTYKRGWYVSGWIKNGPKGVIATTMMDSFDTAEKILEDLSNEIYNVPNESSDIEKILPSPYVSWNGWKTIDLFELRQGRLLGKSRSKLRTINEMVQASRDET